MENKYSEYRCTHHYGCENPYFLEGKDKKGNWKLRFAVSSYAEAKKYLDNTELIEPTYKGIVNGGLFALGFILVVVLIYIGLSIFK
jgi:hypothetical protein